MIVLGAVSLAALSCKTRSEGTRALDEAGASRGVAVRPLETGAIADAAPVAPWIDCVGVLHVVRLRGLRVANAQRFGEDAATLRTTSRLADLSPSDLRTYCDWEACIRANGYGHVCGVNDGGWESCHACGSPAECNGSPMSQDDCVARATDPGRAQCHVGLLQECLLQQALRGPADKRVTRSCKLSQQACAGALPGDLSNEALGAQRETEQVTIEEAKEEAAIVLIAHPDAAAGPWPPPICVWDGGLPPGEDASWADDFLCHDGGPSDAASDSQAGD
jgi:hypothetical protein